MTVRTALLQPIATALVFSALAATDYTRATAGEPDLTLATPFELADQYGDSHKFVVPLTNVCILTLADRKGSEQIAPWVKALTKRYGRRLPIFALADVTGVPSPLRPLIRQRFRSKVAYRVMLDWSGSVVRTFDPVKNSANIYLILKDGQIPLRVHGETTAAKLEQIYQRLDREFPARKSWP